MFCTSGNVYLCPCAKGPDLLLKSMTAAEVQTQGGEVPGLCLEIAIERPAILDSMFLKCAST